jgi:pyridoxine kinase
MSVISIQSQVAFGHVGNSAAVFPMQVLGINVMAVPTALLSNRPRYPTVRGRILDADLVSQLLLGLEERGAVDACKVILSGYLGSPEVADVVADFVARAMKRNPTLIYCCDPVMGDADCGLFVAPGLPELFRDRLCPLANIVTPNQFELGWLVQEEIRTEYDLAVAARSLSAARSSTVLVTGACLVDEPNDAITTFSVEGSSVWSVTTPKIPIAPSGTGDLVAALFVASLIRGSTTPDAMSEAVSATFAIIQETAAAGSTEMTIVASAADMAAPRRTFEAVARECIFPC